MMDKLLTAKIAKTGLSKKNITTENTEIRRGNSMFYIQKLRVFSVTSVVFNTYWTAPWRDIITTRFMILIVLFALGACTNTRAQNQVQGVSRQTPTVSERLTGAASFDDAIGRDWALIELRSDAGIVAIDREKLTAQGFGGAFTLRFDAERLSGAGAPNRYTAPYTLSEDQSISIGLVAGTLMAAIFEPEELKENEYYTLLQNVSQWNLADGKLELVSGETVLVFGAE